MVAAKTRRTCDVVVIGGGPGGSTAGHLLARAGRHVLVLERERFPRFHIGESLLPANMPLLERLGVRQQIEDVGSVPKYGASILAAEGSPSLTVHFAQGLLPCPANAFQVVRSTFDEILLRACGKAGAEVLEEHRALDALRTSTGWRVRVRGPDREEFTLDARHLVDASGRDTFLAAARRSKQMEEHHRRVAIYAHFHGVAQAPNVEPGNIVLALRRDGWLWAIPLAEETTSIGLVVQGHALRKFDGSAAEAFEHSLAHTPVLTRLLTHAKRTTSIQTTSNYSYSSGSAAHQNAAIIGDALAFLDPVFSTGVWIAMQGGESAAGVLDECLSQPEKAARLLEAWSKQQERTMRYYWRLIEAFYRPEFLDLFLQPSRAPLLRTLVPSLNSAFAGMGPGSLGLRARLRMFELLQWVQSRFPLQPRLALGSVFDS